MPINHRFLCNRVHFVLQVLNEGCEGRSSGVKHFVAVPRVEEPLQTGECDLFEKSHFFIKVPLFFLSDLLKTFCRPIYEQDGWNYTHFVTPVSTLERDRYRSQPTLPTSPLQMSPVIQSGLSSVSFSYLSLSISVEVDCLLLISPGGSATSSPAMLGIRRHSSNYQRAQSSMQLDTYYGDSVHKRQYTG